MLTLGKLVRPDRFIDPKRTGNFLSGPLRAMQGGLDQAKTEPLPARLWRRLLSRKGDREFMSAVCNRYVRPNTKKVLYADRTA
jgi:hypothetical protein